MLSQAEKFAIPLVFEGHSLRKQVEGVQLPIIRLNLFASRIAGSAGGAVWLLLAWWNVVVVGHGVVR